MDWMATEIQRVDAEYFRPHVVGDFYSARYAKAWLAVMTKCPRTTFALYTRSWRIETILTVLQRMSRLPNVMLWFSCDRETEAPPRMPRARRAYMMINDADIPDFPVDMVFRDQTKTPMKWVAGHLVCPYEQTVKRPARLTCSRCLICYREKPVPKQPQKPSTILATV